MFAIVPNHVSEAINKELDKFLKDNPTLVDKRDDMYNDLLVYYHRTGEIAELVLQKEE